ncbi:aromatic hydrocarbon degradation protein [Sulfuriferula plumbiphila]|uniref:Aromatic hydrocarbon degradation protein n=1 Tax=Sulfuriferula plumbiphila TaxID=171865 RepID=A0A512LBY6_9PROT|nr:outer membrane protein transport protein [Sulfuriferula plumbiphila]BBP04741.1 aromatic hydrocarbon degradation protein [Sulfuriferula plumbiphila]GEP32005.1 aromatic hydrocarbon degradation protein [Sulfuriferula plumbiphila]
MSTKKVVSAVLITVCGLAVANHAAASGFALIEESASGLGNAFAGGAASAEDASTLFFNPAGMTRLSGKQVSLVLHAIKPTVEFSNTGSTAAAGRPPGNSGGDAGDWAALPNFYYTMELSPQLRAGMGISSPFGLKTEYDQGWMGRFQAIKSDLKTVNINPSLAYKVNDHLSLGAGLDAQYIKAELINAVNLGVAEGLAQVKGDAWSVGYNLGVLYEMDPATRFGLAYRSDVRHKLEGDVTFSGGVPAPNGPISAEITLPETVSFSGFRQINPQWAVMGDVTWTRWSRFKELRIVRDTGALVGLTTENWDDTLRYALGANYQATGRLKLRSGVAYDQSPVSDPYRTARIPDANRTWLTAGAGYKLSGAGSVDVGYAHIFVNNASINTGTASTGKLVGTYNNSVDILSVQYNHRF